MSKYIIRFYYGLLIFLSILILLCGLLLFDLQVHAEAMPTIDSSTFQLINGGVDSLHSSSMSTYGLFPSLPNSLIDVINDFLTVDTSLDANDLVIRPLTDLEQSDIESGFTPHYYDNEGNEIPLSDLYYVTGSNDFYTCAFYMDSSGHVLFQDPEHTHHLLSLGLNSDFASPVGSYNNWQQVYSDLHNRILSQNFNYSPVQGANFGNSTYFLWYGTTLSSGKQSAYVLIENQYNPRVIVPDPNYYGSIQAWYCNDLSVFNYVQTSGDMNFRSISEGDYVKDNIHYKYHISVFPGLDFQGLENQVVDYYDWLAGLNNGFLFGIQNYVYGSHEEPSATFRRVEPPEVPYISPNELYDYDELTLIQPDPVPELNPDFNPSSPINPDNYPSSYPMPDNLPLPTTYPYPGYSQVVNPSPAPSDNPIVELDPTSELPFNVPILNNLSRRFPFSIPFDLKRFMQNSVQLAMPPAWNFDYTITVWGNSWTTHFQGDLSAFNGLAELLRTLELLAFIVWLAYISYKFFF